MINECACAYLCIAVYVSYNILQIGGGHLRYVYCISNDYLSESVIWCPPILLRLCCNNVYVMYASIYNTYIQCVVFDKLIMELSILLCISYGTGTNNARYALFLFTNSYFFFFNFKLLLYYSTLQPYRTMCLLQQRNMVEIRFAAFRCRKWC